ncbi:MAG: MBL fold metallo-hydrolase [Planctomycetes bacterium]|nr:MBL fold metallo-hydrolase [Planctomycetota bacterium]
MSAGPGIVFHTRHPRWLSNSWLVADRPGGAAVVIDTGGPLEPIAQRIAEQRLTLTHVLCTHHHPDHVAHNGDYRARYGCPVCGHAAERALFGDLDVELADGDELVVGGLHIRALHVPGHTVGQLAFLVDERDLFSGDTLFRGSVGGTRGRGHTTYDDLRHSVLDVLLALPGDTVVHPGHMGDTTVRRELADNPFVRFWTGRSAPLERRCEAFGEPGTLLVEAPDYDGGTKCIVRFDSGALDVVPGSRVRAAPR